MKSSIEKLKEKLKDLIEPQSYEMWIKPLHYHFTDHQITVMCSSDFSANLIKERYGSIIKTLMEELTRKKIEITYSIESSADMEDSIKTVKHTNSYFEIEPNSDLKLCPKFNFSTFVVGKNNQLACAAAKAVASNPGTTYNPLFIYGATGLGKTHLMQAIGHEVKKNDKKKKVVYIPCEEFTNQMIESIQKGTTASFRTRFRKVDILMVDDVQFLAKKEQTQEEFFNTFNALYHDRKQIILTSDCQPKDMTHLQQRLVSRFEWGLVTDIQPPPLETRISILTKKCELSNLKVPHEVIVFLSENIMDNVRQIEGALNKVYTYAKLVKRELTIDLAREVLKDLIRTEKTKRISIEEVQRHV
ncbi:MAG: chromosomal replication initiator protein DnaA, partial [Candidatus Aureabacteria bacterium]|nr:chromosomal replication initiator protein DnaA [Candidatus Auribacterota bacterium]